MIYRLDPAKLRQLTELRKTLSAEIGALMQRRYMLPPDRPRWRKRDGRRLDQLIAYLPTKIEKLKTENPEDRPIPLKSQSSRPHRG
jgi:hypothetical protein